MDLLHFGLMRPVAVIRQSALIQCFRTQPATQIRPLVKARSATIRLALGISRSVMQPVLISIRGITTSTSATPVTLARPTLSESGENFKPPHSSLVLVEHPLQA